MVIYQIMFGPIFYICHFVSSVTVLLLLLMSTLRVQQLQENPTVAFPEVSLLYFCLSCLFLCVLGVFPDLAQRSTDT